MPKWDMRQSGSGGHVHQSLWQNSANRFIEGGAPSPLCRAYAAGQLATLADFTAIFLALNGTVDVSAGMVTVNAGMSKFSGVVQADTVITNSVISASYSPGVGNIW